MSDNVTGWEIMYSHYKADIKTKMDLMVLVVHFCLTKYGFRSITRISANETFSSSIHGKGSETLPTDWNLLGDNITLDYVYQKQHFRLRCAPMAGRTVFNLAEYSDNPRVAGTLLDVEQSVAAIDGPVCNLIPEIGKITEQIGMELIQPFVIKRTQDSGTQTDKQSRKLVSADNNPDPLSAARNPEQAQPMPLSVGMNDLYPTLLPRPLGGGMSFPPQPMPGGGGMLFDPFDRRNARPQGIGGGFAGRDPPGFVPGARFDPIGPGAPNPIGPFFPTQGPRPRMPGTPDPDHMPPPGYEDMFM